ncbi:MAG: glycosyltransferase family 4 protein [Myxococcales bacterium]|nr:glycosyltransferase family 4 protein [Myxococcales bacterium]
MSERGPILINAVSQVFGGGVVVAQNLTAKMAELRPDDRLILVSSLDEVAEFSYPENVEVCHLPALLSRPNRWYYEQRHLPAVIAERGARAILNLGGFACARAKVPQLGVWQNPHIYTPTPIAQPLGLRLYAAIQRVVARLSLSKNVQNIFLTEASITDARSWWPMDEIAHTVINNGVDRGRIVKRNARPSAERDNTVLSIGHLYYHKNYEAMIDAIACYRDRYGDDLELEIVGSRWDEAYSKSLDQRIIDRKVGDLVTLSGTATAEEVASKLDRAGVYLITSRLETFGLTTLEAMGSGLPVVVADASCLPEVAGDAALYCDPNDPNDIAEKLHRVLSDPSLQADLRERGFARVEEFSWDRAAERYWEEIDRAIRGGLD